MIQGLKLHYYAVIVAIATLLLIVAGALVTSNDAGLAAPDWPLAYGQLFPPMVGNLFYEHGHRLFAAMVGLMVTVLAVWVQVKESRRWVRRLALAALGLVVVQGLLGGITVLLELPLAVSTAHACIAQLFFCSIVSLAVVTSQKWTSFTAEAEDTRNLTVKDTSSRLKLIIRWGVAAVATIFMQLLLGAVLRHAVTWAETPPLGLVLLHVIGAVAVLLTTGKMLLLVLRHQGQRKALGTETRLMRQLARLVAGLLSVQILLGILTYWVRLHSPEAAQPLLPLIVVTVAHVACGALVLGATLAMTLVAARTLHFTNTAAAEPHKSQDRRSLISEANGSGGNQSAPVAAGMAHG